MKFLLLLTTLAMWGGTSSYQTQVQITVKIFDSHTMKPLENTEIVFFRSDETTKNKVTTDESGTSVLLISCRENEKYYFLASKEGYISDKSVKRITNDKPLEVIFYLVPND